MAKAARSVDLDWFIGNGGITRLIPGEIEALALIGWRVVFISVREVYNGRFDEIFFALDWCRMISTSVFRSGGVTWSSTILPFRTLA